MPCLTPLFPCIHFAVLRGDRARFQLFGDTVNTGKDGHFLAI